MTRLIAKLEIKNNFLIKGINYEGLRKIGSPNIYAQKYFEENIDEIIFTDVVASLYGRNSLFNVIEEATKNLFVTITIGGGLRSIEDIRKALENGADKIAINTSVVQNPNLLKEASKHFGSQCIVLSVQAKKISLNRWCAYIENGKSNTGVDVLEWIKKCQDLGAGEILLNSIDHDGTELGPELDLIEKVAEICTVPLIISGGIVTNQHIDLVKSFKIDAIAVASALHYNLNSIKNMKKAFQ